MSSPSGESAEIVIDLPMPPSVNRLWRHSRGHVYVTKEYKAWREEAGHLVNRRSPKTEIQGPFEAWILLARGYKGDGDNRIKAVLDLLQSHQVIKNDRDCAEGHWKWVPHIEVPLGCRVHLLDLSE